MATYFIYMIFCFLLLNKKDDEFHFGKFIVCTVLYIVGYLAGYEAYKELNQIYLYDHGKNIDIMGVIVDFILYKVF